MSCYNYETLLRYEEDDLPAIEKAEVKHHLNRCVRCQDRLDHLEETWVSLGMLEDITLPDEFEQNVQSRIRTSTTGRSTVLNLNAVRTILVAAAVLLVCGLFILKNQYRNHTDTDATHDDNSIATQDDIDTQDDNSTDTIASVDLDTELTFVEHYILPDPAEDFLDELEDLASLDRIEQEEMLFDLLFPVK